ncbi:hypothetical protein GF323_06495 [Candidatus Woesearchaeota archaeon]|nr:hypothetical protein [Candidatus Woesearchaeota archaeon]
MRLAYIEWHLWQSEIKWRANDISNLISGLENKGIEVKKHSILPWFEEAYGPLDRFDGLIAHPGVKWQAHFVAEIPKLYPNLPIVFVGGIHDDDKAKIPIFEYRNIDAIVDYFQSHIRGSGKCI